jgi:hypothetical protein
MPTLGAADDPSRWRIGRSGAFQLFQVIGIGGSFQIDRLALLAGSHPAVRWNGLQRPPGGDQLIAQLPYGQSPRGCLTEPVFLLCHI